MISKTNLYHHNERRKLEHHFHPVPIGLPYEFIDTDRRASHIERIYWIMECIKMNRYLSVRHVQKKCKCSRHIAKRDLDHCRTMLGVRPPSDRHTTKRRTANGQQGGAVELTIVENLTATDQSTDKSDQQTDTNNKRKRKEKENILINTLLKPLGKRCKPELINKDVVEAWNHWYTLNSTARTVNGEDARCIKSAIKAGYTVEDLKDIIVWANKSDDYEWQRKKNFTRCKNFLNLEKIDGNHEKAQAFKDKSNRPQSANSGYISDDMPDHLMNRRYGPNGHLLPAYGGDYRAGGDY